MGRLNLLEYDALIQRRQSADNRLRLNAGIIAAAVFNCAPFGDPDRKPVSPFDFVPDWKEIADAERDTEDLSQMTPMQQRDYLMNMFCKRTMTKR